MASSLALISFEKIRTEEVSIVNRMVRAAVSCLAIAVASAGAVGAQKRAYPSEIAPAIESMTVEDLLAHVKVLASDEFEGRKPMTKGEELTVDYLTKALEKMGAEPGNPNGSYVQEVPLVGFRGEVAASFDVKGTKMALEPIKDYVALSRRFTPESKVEASPVVFVGYGVVAPEYGWDDYKGVDVKGKTIVMLVNDPPVPDAKSPTKLDERVFKGDAMTYYGRWTYKYEIAAEKGAAAAVIVHETGPAGYPFEVVSGSWGRENLDVQTPDRNMGRAAVEAWITVDKAKALFAAAGKDFDALKREAATKKFAPVALDATADFTVKNTLREAASKNVVAKVTGSDAKLRDEYVVYSAHWDHLGRNDELEGDQIFNGALDNASGAAALLELAEAYTKMKTKPKRSVLFLFTTAEEAGLLGAKYYAANPLYPLAKTLANINIDGINVWGRTKDVVIVGYGNSSLDDLLVEAAKKQERAVEPDPEPEKGYFYRSDHFELAKRGVPALYADSGEQFVGRPAGWGRERHDEYVAKDYHKVSDEVKESWDLSGAVEDLRLYFLVGLEVANGSKWPTWRPGTEFKATREATLKGR
jgi:Zn-dependent M28 family amino/carboxypeptidase